MTPNDALDADTGANGLQNYPLIASAVPLSPSGTEIVGTLDSTPSTSYALDFFANPACAGRPHDFEEGLVYIGSSTLPTDGAGHADFDVTLAYTIEAGPARDRHGDRPERKHVGALAPHRVLDQPGLRTARGRIALRGPRHQLRAGRRRSRSEGFPRPTSSGRARRRSRRGRRRCQPGALSDVTLTNVDLSSGTLSKGYVTDFNDVPQNQHVPRLRHDPRLQRHHRRRRRRQLRRRVEHAAPADGGLPAQGEVRGLLRAAALHARHLRRRALPRHLRATGSRRSPTSGITGGCGSGNYCPTSPVRRDQMAVFLLKAEHGSTYVPPACTPPGVFTDVLCPGTFADWIERLAAENVTGGCGAGIYCPGNPNTRGQMAVFIVKTFLLQ